MRTALILVFIAAFCVALGTPQSTPAGLEKRDAESVLDTPEAHYNQGMKKMLEGDLDAALAEFQQTLKLNPKHPGAYLGFALIRGQQGVTQREASNIDKAKSWFRDALRYVDNAKRYNKKSIEVYITKGRVLAMRQKGNWLKDALKAYKDARKIDDRDDRVPFHEGEAYWMAGEYQEAENAYGRAVDLKGPTQDRAATRFAQVQMVRKAAPGTEVGIRIARMDPATRADLCALLVDELKVETLVDKLAKKEYDTSFKAPGETVAPGQTQGPIDIEGHWARSWVERVLALKVPGLEAYPDGSFKPNDPVTRKDLARVLQGLLVLITKDQGLSTRFVGTQSRFPDVRADVYYYNAVALAVERGLMQVGKLEGTFRPDATVSGAEAVLAIKDLKDALMTR